MRAVAPEPLRHQLHISGTVTFARESGLGQNRLGKQKEYDK